MIEKWKDIDGYEGYYQVSNFGEVRTVGHKYQRKGFHKIKLHNNRNGYWLADLHKNNLYKSKAIHRLVAKAFLPNPNNLPEVNHIDGNKANNCVDNLEWVSKSQNKWHACNVLGQRTNRIKDFSTGNIFPSQKSAALYYGVSESLIKSIVKKQIFSKRKKKQEITNHRIEIISEREYIDSLNKSKLVDVINVLQAQVAILEEHAHPTATTDRMIGCTTLDIPESYIKTCRMDKEFAEEEMKRLQKENSDLSDKIGKLQKQLAEWQNANVSLIKDSAICNTYTHIRWDELCRLREIADKYAEITGHKGVQNE